MRRWLARHLPWWVPLVMWYPVVVFVGLLWVYLLVGAVFLAGWSAIDLDVWKALRSLWFFAMSASAATWWFREARLWRKLRPSVLRGRAEVESP